MFWLLRHMAGVKNTAQNEGAADGVGRLPEQWGADLVRRGLGSTPSPAPGGLRQDSALQTHSTTEGDPPAAGQAVTRQAERGATLQQP